MAAKDYVIVAGMFNLYLAKKKTDKERAAGDEPRPQTHH